jgi:hypothetical protein
MEEFYADGTGWDDEQLVETDISPVTWRKVSSRWNRGIAKPGKGVTNATKTSSIRMRRLARWQGTRLLRRERSKMSTTTKVVRSRFSRRRRARTDWSNPARACSTPRWRQECRSSTSAEPAAVASCLARLVEGAADTRSGRRARHCSPRKSASRACGCCALTEPQGECRFTLAYDSEAGC